MFKLYYDRYENGVMFTEPETDATIIAMYRKADDIMNGLNDDEWNIVIDAVEIVATNDGTKEEIAQAEKVIAVYGLDSNLAKVWYCHDDEEEYDEDDDGEL